MIKIIIDSENENSQREKEFYWKNKYEAACRTCFSCEDNKDIIEELQDTCKGYDKLSDQYANLQDKVDKALELIKVQCGKGNYDQDEYMRGMANGMIIIKSIFTDKEPEFKESK